MTLVEPSLSSLRVGTTLAWIRYISSTKPKRIYPLHDILILATNLTLYFHPKPLYLDFTLLMCELQLRNIMYDTLWGQVEFGGNARNPSLLVREDNRMKMCGKALVKSWWMESLGTPFTRIHPRLFHTLSQYKIQIPEEIKKVLVTGYSAKFSLYNNLPTPPPPRLSTSADPPSPIPYPYWGSKQGVCSLEKKLTSLPQADSIKCESKTPLFYGLSGHSDSCTDTKK